MNVNLLIIPKVSEITILKRKRALLRVNELIRHKIPVYTRKYARTYLSTQSILYVSPWVLKDEMHLTDYPLTGKMAVKLLDISAKLCCD